MNSQDYFWTPEWQEDEKEADEDIENGRVIRFSDAEAAICYLQSTDYYYELSTKEGQQG